MTGIAETPACWRSVAAAFLSRSRVQAARRSSISSTLARRASVVARLGSVSHHRRPPAPPRVVIGDGDRNPCVVTIGRVDAMGRLARVSIPEIDRIDARLDRSEVLLTQEIDGRFRLGQFDKLALASAFSMVEGGEHCGGEHLAGDVIGMVHGRAGRIRTVGVAPQQVDAGKAALSGP